VMNTIGPIAKLKLEDTLATTQASERWRGDESGAARGESKEKYRIMLYSARGSDDEMLEGAQEHAINSFHHSSGWSKADVCRGMLAGRGGERSERTSERSETGCCAGWVEVAHCVVSIRNGRGNFNDVHFDLKQIEHQAS